MCHVVDTVNLYIELLRSILAGANPDHGRQGYYLAASGSVAWDDIYDAMAEALAKRDEIKDGTVNLADDEALLNMATGLGVPKELVSLHLSGM